MLRRMHFYGLSSLSHSTTVSFTHKEPPLSFLQLMENGCSALFTNKLNLYQVGTKVKLLFLSFMWEKVFNFQNNQADVR